MSQSFPLRFKISTTRIGEVWSKWLEDPLEARIAFYLPSKSKSKVMQDSKRQLLIEGTMKFLIKELGGGTQIDALGSFQMNGEVVSEKVAICYSFLSKTNLAVHEREINQIANALAIEFEQDSIAVEVNDKFYLFSPNASYIRNYKRDMVKATKRGTEWSYKKWLRVPLG